VVSYREQSPYHAFADRHVVASGAPYKPDSHEQHISTRDGRLGHFCVSTMRLAEVTPDAPLVEIGPAQDLSGRFERGKSDTGRATLSFVTRWRGTFQIVNDPAGAAVGRSVEVVAFPVQPSPSIRKPLERYLWFIRPCSEAVLWEWRRRQ
jgi:hypothetical protein